MRITSPSEWKRFMNRQVVVAYLSESGERCKTTFHVQEAENQIQRLVVYHCRILRVDGVAPPKGSDGRCHFDADGAGPYWKGDL